MGLLQKGRKLLTLSARFEIGRNTDCSLHIADRRVSGRHARLVWTREGWQLRDLGSTNGTTLDGKRIEPGQDYPLKLGSVIAFGASMYQWVLSDTAPPQAMAISTSGTRCFAEEGLLALPSEDDPHTVVFERESGIWLAETNGEPRQVADQEHLSVRDEAWVLSLPTIYAKTVVESPRDTSQVGLRFEVSKDEEYTRISMISATEQVPVPTRSHHYMLLLLARARLTDLEEGQSEAEAGWLYSEELSQMLRTDMYQLNVLVHRARRQFSKLNMVDAGQLIERRRLTRQLRLGIEHLEIAPLL